MKNRGVLSLLLMICLIWQQLVFAGQFPAHAATESDEAVAHELLHLTTQPHHHHDDAIHLDDSQESVQHLQGDCLSSASVILPDSCCLVDYLLAQVPGAAEAGVIA